MDQQQQDQGLSQNLGPSGTQPQEQCIVTLNELNPGQSGRILRINGQATARRRLLEMGLVRGETITVERVAPLGDPVAFAVKGYHLSLRQQNAAQIMVELVDVGQVTW